MNKIRRYAELQNQLDFNDRQGAVHDHTTDSRLLIVRSQERAARSHTTQLLHEGFFSQSLLFMHTCVRESCIYIAYKLIHLHFQFSLACGTLLFRMWHALKTSRATCNHNSQPNSKSLSNMYIITPSAPPNRRRLHPLASHNTLLTSL